MKRVAIIGAGVVGCAIAQELSRARHEIHVFEKNSTFGEGVTSRNSGVIHSGLYYPPDSLKAKLCIEGNKMLYAWCREYSVPHRKTGKIILAQVGEEADLQLLIENAVSSGVDKRDLAELTSQDLRILNPYLNGLSGLLSRESGVVDVSQLCRSLYSKASQQSTMFHFDCPVEGITARNGYVIQTPRGEMEVDAVINAAGLYSDEIADFSGRDRYTIFPWRGDYFKIRLPYPMNQLVYPVRKANASGLGIHITLDMNGNVFLGPDVEPSDSKDNFSDRPDKQMSFFEAASRLLKDISPEMLTYEMCGIRPKLRGFDETRERDFVISEDKPQFINLVGIESPGLTSALAIAKYMKGLLLGAL